MKSFLIRLGSSFVLLAVLIATGIAGGAVLFVFTLALSLIGYLEFLRVFGLEKKLPGRLGFLFVLLYYAAVYTGAVLFMHGLLVIAAFLMALMAVYVFTFPRYRTEEIAEAFFGLIYVAVMLSFLYLTRTVQVGGQETPLVYFLIFICSWGCDTCAYAVGMLFGKHPLAPVLSPKKSIEGAVGGVVGAALLGLIYASVFQFSSRTACVLLCAAGAVVSQIGDLAASAIKRNHGVKDYGRLIPGHGGVLDRFDSVIFTAPLVYALAVLALQ